MYHLKFSKLPRKDSSEKAIFTFAMTFTFLLQPQIQQSILNYRKSQHMTYPYSLNQKYTKSAKHVETQSL